MIDPIEQFKIFGGTSITFLGTITAWVTKASADANIILSMVASLVAIVVGIMTARTLFKRLELQDLDAELKQLEIRQAKNELKMQKQNITDNKK